MFSLFCFVLAVLASPFKSKSRLEAENAALRVDKVLRDLPNGKKSVRASCRQQLKVEPFKSVVEYCQKCIGSTKPQWQIIAEHHGWGPKIK